MRKAPAAP
uniref:Uncharacterized protein n=1 Tax=Arundo donax TaxID=35708 RepID=A0A0A9H8N5_ARUDO